ncbi:MAG TPA: hypothetical protein EYN69_04920 [Flavobacteriales bacterium]|nr:hypothetical protein [Flavobacteriales bacterium]
MITEAELVAAKANKAKIGGGVSVVANTITIVAAGGISGTSALADNTVFVSTFHDLSINSLSRGTGTTFGDWEMLPNVIFKEHWEKKTRTVGDTTNTDGIPRIGGVYLHEQGVELDDTEFSYYPYRKMKRNKYFNLPLRSKGSDEALRANSTHPGKYNIGFGDISGVRMNGSPTRATDSSLDRSDLLFTSPTMPYGSTHLVGQPVFKFGPIDTGIGVNLDGGRPGVTKPIMDSVAATDRGWGNSLGVVGASGYGDRRWDGYARFLGAVVMISPRHCIFTWHMKQHIFTPRTYSFVDGTTGHTPTGSTEGNGNEPGRTGNNIIFYTETGEEVVRQIVGIKQIKGTGGSGPFSEAEWKTAGNSGDAAYHKFIDEDYQASGLSGSNGTGPDATDIGIGYLNEDIPSSIKYYKLLSQDDYENYGGGREAPYPLQPYDSTYSAIDAFMINSAKEVLWTNLLFGWNIKPGDIAPAGNARQTISPAGPYPLCSSAIIPSFSSTGGTFRSNSTRCFAYIGNVPDRATGVRIIAADPDPTGQLGVQESNKEYQAAKIKYENDILPLAPGETQQPYPKRGIPQESHVFFKKIPDGNGEYLITHTGVMGNTYPNSSTTPGGAANDGARANSMHMGWDAMRGHSGIEAIGYESYWRGQGDFAQQIPYYDNEHYSSKKRQRRYVLQNDRIYGDVNTGDSGSPWFFPYKGELILLSMTTWPSQWNLLGHQISPINSAMAELEAEHGGTDGYTAIVTSGVRSSFTPEKPRYHYTTEYQHPRLPKGTEYVGDVDGAKILDVSFQTPPIPPGYFSSNSTHCSEGHILTEDPSTFKCSPADGEHDVVPNWVYIDVTFDKPVTTKSNTHLTRPNDALFRYGGYGNHNNGKIENLTPPTNGYIPIYDHIWNSTEYLSDNPAFGELAGGYWPNVEPARLKRWNPRDPELDLGNHAWYVQLGWANNTHEKSANAFYISGSGTNKLTFGHIANAHSFVTDGQFFLKANTRILSAYGIGDYDHASSDGYYRAAYNEPGVQGLLFASFAADYRDKAYFHEPLGINWDDGSHVFERTSLSADTSGTKAGYGTANSLSYEIAEYSLVGGRSPYGFTNLTPGGKMTQNAAINLGMAGSEYITGDHDHYLYASTWINSDVNLGSNGYTFSETGVAHEYEGDAGFG